MPTMTARSSSARLPLKKIDNDFVYQKLIDNTTSIRETKDFRVAIIGYQICDILEQFRPSQYRFLHTNVSQANRQKAGAVFTQSEIRKIIQFCVDIGLEVGELDILRDNGDSKIYIVDANKTAAFPHDTFTLQRFLLAWRRARSFRRYLSQRLKRGAGGAHGRTTSDRLEPS